MIALHFRFLKFDKIRRRVPLQKVLVINKFIPAPAFGGGSKRSLAWLRFLSKHYEVTLVGHWDKEFGDQRIAELRDYTKEIFGFPHTRTVKSLFITALHALSSNQSVTLLQYHQREMQEKIDELCAKETFAFILCEELSSMQYVRNIRGTPVFLDDQNIEYELADRAIKNATFFLRPVFRYEASRIRSFEQASWKQVEKTFFVSERDRAICAAAVPEAPCAVLENTFSENGIAILPPAQWFEAPTIAFVGNISWGPNRNGLNRFLTKIYPLVKQTLPETEFYLMGSCATKEIRKLCEKNQIHLLENVEEEKKSEILSRCWVTVAPVYYGGGTRVKILEYWAHAKATVSTVIGNEGLAPSAGTWSGDEDREMAQTLISLLQDRQIAAQMGRQNHEVFKRFYEETAVYGDSLYRSITAQLHEQESL